MSYEKQKWRQDRCPECPTCVSCSYSQWTGTQFPKSWHTDKGQFGGKVQFKFFVVNYRSYYSIFSRKRNPLHKIRKPKQGWKHTPGLLQWRPIAEHNAGWVLYFAAHGCLRFHSLQKEMRMRPAFCSQQLPNLTSFRGSEWWRFGHLSTSSS